MSFTRLALIVLMLCLGCATSRVTPAPNVLATLAPTVLLVSTNAPNPFVSLTAPATATPSATPTLTPMPIPARVVIISIDGLRPDGLLQASSPNILALARRGSYTWQAQTVFPSVTLPAHTSMLTGFLPEAHKITWNSYRPEAGTVGVPTIFSLAHEAGLRTVMVVGKEKFEHLHVPNAVDEYVFARNGDNDVVEQAMVQAQAGFDLMFVHLPNVDYFGHLYGWMSERYIAEIRNTDEAVGRLLAALPEDTTVIVTSDHGGHGLSHGADIPEDMTIPWIIAGPRVLNDYALTTAVITVDTAATAAHVLGLTLPPEAVGVPVYEAFGESALDLLHGAWTEGAAQAPARSEMPAAALSGLIYVPGGFGGEVVFQVYDPAQDVWHDLAPLPAGRHHLMTAVFDNRVYIFGGAESNAWSPTATAYVYDSAQNTWAELASMPEPRMAGAAVALNGKLYVVGGIGQSSALLEYDPATNHWRSLAKLREPREHLAAVVLNGEIYALGGRWSAVGELASVEIYDPTTGLWRAGPDLLRPHAGFSAAVLKGHLLVAGGEIIVNGRETLTAFEIYDPRTQAWSAGPDLPYPIHGVAAATVGDRFYLLGGSSRAGAIENFGRVMIYTP